MSWINLFALYYLTVLVYTKTTIHLSVGRYQWRNIRNKPSLLRWIVVNPFTPSSDQEWISPHNIYIISSRQVMRI